MATASELVADLSKQGIQAETILGSEGRQVFWLGKGGERRSVSADDLQRLDANGALDWGGIKKLAE